MKPAMATQEEKVRRRGYAGSLRRAADLDGLPEGDIQAEA